MNISDLGKEMLAFQAKLAEENHYKPLPQSTLFYGDVRQKYKDALPEWCVLEGNLQTPLYSSAGTTLCTGYNRIVIGDYGAFIEISPEQIIKENLIVKKGQEFRINEPQYKDRVKYHWLTAKDTSDCKIYFQQKTVEYADYIPGMYYISPYECTLTPEISLDSVIKSCKNKTDNNQISRRKQQNQFEK